MALHRTVATMYGTHFQHPTNGMTAYRLRRADDPKGCRTSTLPRSGLSCHPSTRSIPQVTISGQVAPFIPALFGQLLQVGARD